MKEKEIYPKYYEDVKRLNEMESKQNNDVNTLLLLNRDDFLDAINKSRKEEVAIMVAGINATLDTQYIYDYEYEFSKTSEIDVPLLANAYLNAFESRATQNERYYIIM
jgi:hypothetical protein